MQQWPSLTLESLLEQPFDQTHILTVNNRTARELVKFFTPQTGQVQALPTITPWSAWLKQRLFDVGLNAASEHINAVSTVVDAFSSQVMWAQIIEEIEVDRPLLDVNRAAQQAASAHNLMLAWHIDVPLHQQTPEFKQFKLWRDRYIECLQSRLAIDASQLPHLIESLIQMGVVDLPQTIVLLGFTEWSPADLALLHAISIQGVDIKQLILPSDDEPDVSLISCLDASDEWRRAAQWAYQQLSQRPTERFAIVAPNLQTDAPHAKRVLTRILQDVQRDEHFSFNIAVAPALADWPAMRAALGWLGWLMQASHGQEVSVDQAGPTLLQGFCVGHESEAADRALIDNAWRHREIMSVTQSDWHLALSRLPKLAQAWQAALEVTQDLKCTSKNLKQSAFGWTVLWRQQLSALGFPGDMTLDSVTYQVVQAIEKQFEKFTALDQVLKPMSAHEALGLMSRMVRQSPFQPQRDPAARLDVLGLLEAEGGRWHAVWVMGLNDEVLPAAPNPNPFIPLPVLVAAQAPRATPERERLWAEQIFKTLLQCAPELVLSWPEQAGERQLRASPLLTSLLSAQACQSLVKENALNSLGLWNQIQVSVWVDDDVPRVMAEEKVKGGVGLFETQARNPLWAFFKYRLGVNALKPYALARPFSEQGDFVHAVMREVVARYPTKMALQLAFQQADWQSNIRIVIVEKAQQKLKGMAPQLQAMHVERALNIVHTWCEFDSARLPYTNVAAEETFKFIHGPLELTLQIDRVDQLDEGGYVVIDYKTGHIPKDLQKEWSRTQPISNQLLTYSIAWQQQHPTVSPIHALVLAQIKPHQVKTAGLCIDDVGLPGVKIYEASEWPLAPQAVSFELMATEQVALDRAVSDSSADEHSANQDWQLALDGLQHKIMNIADSFIAGDASNVSGSINDLLFCDIQALLRLHEIDRDSSDELDVEAGGDHD